MSLPKGIDSSTGIRHIFTDGTGRWLTDLQDWIVRRSGSPIFVERGWRRVGYLVPQHDGIMLDVPGGLGPGPDLSIKKQVG